MLAKKALKEFDDKAVADLLLLLLYRCMHQQKQQNFKMAEIDRDFTQLFLGNQKVF